METKRNINLDVIRCVAILSVISVHFFKWNGFYNRPVLGERMYCMTIMRNAFMICVPLFIILSGYLMSKKELSKKYYCGIVRILKIYIFSSILIYLFDKFYLKINIEWWRRLFQGTSVNIAYAWYVQMYIGLFLLIPFLNLIYNGLKNKKEKIVLISTLLLCTMLPTMFNIDYVIVPSWWKNIYPITYYYIGAYLREYNPKIKIWKNIVILLITIIVFGSFGYYRSYGVKLEWAGYNDWGGIQNVVNSVLVFILLLHINFEKIPVIMKKMIVKISELSFGMYLVSYMFDNIVYPKLNNYISDMPRRMEWIVVTVPIVFLSSMILSRIMNWILSIRLVKKEKI